MNQSWFTSSTGSGDLALTIKGLLLALVPLSVSAFQHYGYVTTSDNLINVVEASFAALSAIVTVVGLVRKVVNRFA